MEYNEFLNRIVDDGIAAVKEDYANDPMKLEGSIEGFEACRSKAPPELKELLTQAGIETREALRKDADDYWHVRCYEAEIEWVCNCVSILLMNANLPVIVPPTARAGLKAASIVREERES